MVVIGVMGVTVEQMGPIWSRRLVGCSYDNNPEMGCGSDKNP